jgi:rubrerythrin
MIDTHRTSYDTNDVTLIDAIDPDIRARFTSRRGIFSSAVAKLGAAATAPAVLALATTEAFGQAPSEIAEILNFALTLEYLEAEFYRTALSTPGLIPRRYRAVFATIGRHEIEHVHTLRGALGSAAIASPRFDFTGKGQFPAVFSDFQTFAAVSSTFEELGVAAYKGQAPNLLGTPTLTVALRIHSVEARHAAEVRRVRGLLGFDGPFDAPKTKQEVLAAAGPFIAG